MRAVGNNNHPDCPRSGSHGREREQSADKKSYEAGTSASQHDRTHSLLQYYRFNVLAPVACCQYSKCFKVTVIGIGFAGRATGVVGQQLYRPVPTPSMARGKFDKQRKVRTGRGELIGPTAYPSGYPLSAPPPRSSATRSAREEANGHGWSAAFAKKLSHVLRLGVVDLPRRGRHARGANPWAAISTAHRRFRFHWPRHSIARKTRSDSALSSEIRRWRARPKPFAILLRERLVTRPRSLGSAGSKYRGPYAALTRVDC